MGIIHTLIFLTNEVNQYQKFQLLKMFADRFSNMSVNLEAFRHLSLSPHFKLFLIQQNHAKFQQFLLPYSYIN